MTTPGASSLDHLVVGCADLARGAAWLERFLGVTLGPVGQHALMGTHNRLLSLGPDCYLELIAIDPAAPP
ncbi:MAG: VOC family protein, partial [Burkholderiales bacterium]